METLDLVLVLVGLLLVAALLDVQTGVSIIDQVIRAVPVDWLPDIEDL